MHVTLERKLSFLMLNDAGLLAFQNQPPQQHREQRDAILDSILYAGQGPRSDFLSMVVNGMYIYKLLGVSFCYVYTIN